MPKEKAKELYDKYDDLLKYELPALRHRKEIKQCAIICANELLANEPGMTFSICVDKEEMTMMDWNEYWKKVVEQIELIAKT